MFPLPVPVFMFDFIEALFLIVIIIDFIQTYRIFYPEVLASQLISLIVATIITFTLYIPYPWVGWLAVFPLFTYSFFYGFQPWTWAQEKPMEGEEYFHHYGAGEQEEG
ncbi:TPA: hypothetical protein HA244_03790 [Candidatus Micrarchaeota archaeon]|nr:hypothetical protein [Candidatus Micrarchaeota archaeon]